MTHEEISQRMDVLEREMEENANKSEDILQEQRKLCAAFRELAQKETDQMAV